MTNSTFTTNPLAAKICSISSVIGDNCHKIDEKIAKSTGIKTLYSLSEKYDSVDLGACAARIILDDIKERRVTVFSSNSALIFITQTPTYKMPSSAFLIQDRLQQEFSMAFDVNLGCSAFPAGLQLATSLLVSKAFDDVLVVISDTVHRISQGNPSVSSIFTDAASAIHLQRGDCESSFDHGTDGSGYKVIHCEHDGSIQMSGLEVYSFAKSVIPDSVLKVASNASQDDSIPVFLHQANQMINSAIIKKIEEKFQKKNLVFPTTIDVFGNSAGSSIPLTMCNQFHSQGYNSIREFIASGFGVGLNWISVHWKQSAPIRMHQPIQFKS